MLEIEHLVVFDVPAMEALQARLRALNPARVYAKQEHWCLPEMPAGTGPESAIPLWYWPDSVETLRPRASDLLREFVYPLVASGRAYCLGLPFGSNEFAPGVHARYSAQDLDWEDIGGLLRRDAVGTTFATLDLLGDRVPFTPIEERLAEAMGVLGIAARPQVKLGPYRADFLVEHEGRRIVVEADGRDFHESGRDARRDEALIARGIEAVLRFTGSQIYRDAPGCAAEVIRHIERRPGSRQRYETAGDLDDAQRAAVWHPSGPARVLAPAGSGKTKTLLNRIMALLDRGVAPEQILVLAFNKKAAAQLEAQLDARGVVVSRSILPKVHAGIVCTTFNAFGERYLREVLGRKLHIEGESVLRDLMHLAMQDCGIDLRSLRTARGSDPVGAFLRTVDLVKADLQAPDALAVALEVARSPAPLSLPFAPVFSAYESRRLSAGVQSYDDQVYATICDLLGDPVHRALLRDQFDHVLVDEFQDLNGAQLALVDILSRPRRNLFVVGDDDQLIYGWRFARPGGLMAFHERMPPRPHAATFLLPTNYRSARAIVDASRRLIDHNRAREPKAISAAPAAPAGRIRYRAAASWQDRARAICEFLVERHGNGSNAWRRLAVLCRYRSQQFLVAQALDAAGIPRTLLLPYQLFAHRHARLLRAYIALVMDPAALGEDGIRQILSRPNRYLPADLIADLASGSAGWEAIERWAAEPRPYGGIDDLVERGRRLRTRFRNDRPTPAQLIDDVVREFELDREWTDGYHARGSQDEAGPREVMAVLRTMAGQFSRCEDFCRDWDRRLADEGRGEQMAPDEFAREASPSADRVVIGTIHSAKGREYDSVVICDYDAQAGRSAGEQAVLEEERRVLYVAVTRASREVLLTIDRSRAPTHPLILELVPPRTGPDELGTCRARLAALHAQARDISADLARARAELAALRDPIGRDRERARGASAARIFMLRQQHDALGRARTQLDDRIAELGL